MPLKFKSEEDRQAAIAAVPEPEEAPTGVNLEEWEKENEQKLIDIMEADIDPEYKEGDGDGQDDQNGNQEPPVGQEGNQGAGNQSADSGKKEPPDEKQIMQNRIDTLIEQRDRVITDTNQKMQDLQAQIEELKQGKSNDDQQETVTQADKEIEKVQNEIKSLEAEMNGIDLEIDQDKYMKSLRTLNSYSLKLTSLVNARSAEILKKQDAQLNQMKQEQELERKSAAKETEQNKMFEMIDKFREDKPEFEGPKYSEMDTQYTDFACEIASIYFSKNLNDVTPEDTEIAMQKYLAGSPHLSETVQAKGLQEPEWLRKFVLLSEINAVKMGYVLNKTTGEWEIMKDSQGKEVRFPSMSSAWAHIQDERGMRAEEILKAQKIATKEMLDAMNRRQNPVELEDGHRKDDVGDMPKERADEVLRQFSEDEIYDRAKKNFKDPLVTEYNKALVKLGHSPIQESDVTGE